MVGAVNLRPWQEAARDSEQLGPKSATEKNRPHVGRCTVLNELGTSLEVQVPVVKFSIFYGYPPELIARWCGVTVDSAKLYKSGARRASRAVLRLFTLHRDGRVLGDGWEGWQARAGTIAGPDGNVISERQLIAYFYVMQFAAALAARDPAIQRDWYELLKRA